MPQASKPDFFAAGGCRPRLDGALSETLAPHHKSLARMWQLPSGIYCPLFCKTWVNQKSSVEKQTADGPQKHCLHLVLFGGNCKGDTSHMHGPWALIQLIYPASHHHFSSIFGLLAVDLCQCCDRDCLQSLCPMPGTWVVLEAGDCSTSCLPLKTLSPAKTLGAIGLSCLNILFKLKVYTTTSNFLWFVGKESCLQNYFIDV